MNYAWDKQFHLSRRPDAGGFGYTDGVETEERLLCIVSGAGDRSTYSEELAAAITDWPSEYHFSRSRHCLIRPLGIRAGAKVLELGCGCGAVTRFLGELGAEVIAVEGSLERGRVAAERCRDLANVHVFVDDLLSFESSEHFDFVLLIGVLEYAPAFSGQDDPIQHYLRSVCRFLRPEGKLVVGIENKLGLKYFNGCAEDHVGVPFFGIQDLYRRGTARTFGRGELRAQLAAAGLPYSYFYYPFPDYKVPCVVFSEEALLDPGFDPVEMLARSHSRDYFGRSHRSFDEALVASALHKNGLLADFSNSFLAVATAKPADSAESDLAVAYSPQRSREFATQTRLVRRGSTIKVVKELLQPSAGPHFVTVGGNTLTHELDDCTYVPGRQLTWNVLAARAATGSLEAIVDSLVPWMKFLLQHAHDSTLHQTITSSGSSSLRSYVIPGHMLDCTTFNLIDTGGGVVPIDMEWKADGNLPLGWVVTRGVAQALTVGGPHASPPQSVAQVVESLCGRIGLSVSDFEVRQWLQQEASFQTAVLGHAIDPASIDRTSSGLRSFVTEIANLNQVAQEQASQIVNLRKAVGDGERCIAELEQKATQSIVVQAERDSLQGMVSELTTEHEIQRRELAECRRQLQAVVHSKSWQLSAPLRATARLCHAVFRRQRTSDTELIAKSEFFDAAWYRACNPDVADAGKDPIVHFLEYGAAEGRDPSPAFRTRWYLEQYADVRATGINPLVHYLRFGKAEGRRPAPSTSQPRSDH